MINKLYYTYLDDLNTNSNKTDINKFLSKISNEYIETNNNKRKVIDYIAGMTDSFLEAQYDKLK
jgi:dGTP triphosphohydrolase